MMPLKINRRDINQLAIYLICFGLPLLCMVLPARFFPIDNLTVVEQRIIAIFFLAAFCWILEPIPIHATSILIIFLELILVSDTSLEWIKSSEGTLLSYRDIMGAFASPIIMLFLGGFFLAKAATKFRLDTNLARILLRPFGTQPRWVMLGLMFITAFFSMFMSNTATTAMMLSILVPILAVLPHTDKGRTGLALSIPLAANIGGIGTPIGTPPNAIALKYLTGADTIGFGQWMSFGVPLALVLLLICWLLLLVVFPFRSEQIELNIKGRFLKNRKAWTVYITFLLTIILWLTDFLHGINAYAVAILPVAVFLATDIINKEDMKKLSWDILWLVSGGIALGYGLDQSGLAEHLVRSIPFEGMSIFAVVGGSAFLAMIMANFMSNTATANLLLPIIAALAVALPGISQIGGSSTIILAVALSASLGMALPISTPPNALAHATGEIQTGQMAKMGTLVGIIGIVLIFLTLWIIA
jgi:sodium-dependent dicarboxylate transporter 2/3/5